MLKITQQVAIKLPATQVWETVGDFSNLSWLPSIESCQLIQQDGELPQRRVTTVDGKVITENCLSYNQTLRFYQYTLDSPKPLQSYASTLRVITQTENSCCVEWSCEADCGKIPEDTVRNSIEQLYSEGLEQLALLFANTQNSGK